MKKLIFTMGMVLAFPVMAAQIGFVSNPDLTRLDLVVTADYPINVIKGIVELGTSTDISTGGSLVPVWIVNPEISGREIKFEGIIPGGVQGSGRILSLYSKNGPIEAHISEFEAYLNDGQGTRDKVVILPIQTSALDSEHEDRMPPESFSPEIAHSSDLFDGKYFLSFSSTDKQSGIDHYEIKEGDRSWVKADSPYLLTDQGLNGDISVKAVDRNGNFIIVKAMQNNALVTNHNSYVVGILILLLLLLIYIWLKKRTYRS